MTLEEIMGKWDESFEYAFNFKAEVERTHSGSLVDIDYAQVGKKVRFTRMFVALKSCVDSFLKGCRPFLGVDSTVLTGRWRGQLASAIAIDGYNWMFPVAYGVFDSETGDNWKWFFERLHVAIGSPPGLVISTDAGKGIDIAVTKVFTNGVEHRECMRYLVKNFQKRYRGDVFEQHLWPACRAYNEVKYDYHYNIMKTASPAAIKWIEDNHKHLWNRCKFSRASKCDYVTNNIAETFNIWIRHEKSLPVIPLMDRIRQLLMEKQDIRRRLASKLKGNILPHIIRDLNAKSRNLRFVIHKGYNHTAEIQGTDRYLVTWRHTINLKQKECSCKEWQLTGLPCKHALCYISSKRNHKMEDYVHSYYSVDMF
uniref:SWIM-type domain-containing protein n=1 Tax=Arundo donax TaxID=35708 RepID=A0A0A9ASX4_ARUDO